MNFSSSPKRFRAAFLFSLILHVAWFLSAQNFMPKNNFSLTVSLPSVPMVFTSLPNVKTEKKSTAQKTKQSEKKTYAAAKKESVSTQTQNSTETSLNNENADKPANHTTTSTHHASELGLRIIPEYPEEARLRGEEGSALFHLIVSKDGKIAKLNMKESTGFDELDRAAREALYQWRFDDLPQYVLESGKPIIIPIEFALLDR